jgi:Cof subfamily protein (haloacid dehalogenase superfamily)
MKKTYKALMLDLDGTTIHNSPDALPSENVVKAVRKAQEKLSVCIATGRPLWRAQPVLDVLHISSPVILLDGSQILDGTSRELLYECPLLKKDIHEILTILEPYHDRTVVDEKNKSVDYADLYKPKNVFNFLVKGLSMTEANAITRELSHLETVTTHKALSWSQGKVILNISHVLATKQHAIFEAAKLLQIDTHEIIGVGDGYNDFPMLMACGLKVAMGNAVTELKDIADFVAPSVFKDGVAEIIEKFIL